MVHPRKLLKFAPIRLRVRPAVLSGVAGRNSRGSASIPLKAGINWSVRRINTACVDPSVTGLINWKNKILKPLP